MNNDKKIAAEIAQGYTNTLVPSTPKLLRKLRGTKQSKCMRAFYSLAESRQTSDYTNSHLSFILAI
jgi:hypothetical protein